MRCCQAAWKAAKPAKPSLDSLPIREATGCGSRLHSSSKALTLKLAVMLLVQLLHPQT